MIDKFKRFFWLWGQCFKSMRRLNTFVPFLFYSILQLLLLYSLVNFTNSTFANIYIPFIRKFFGEPALHYPNFLLILAPLYNQVNIILSGIIGIVIIGIATQLFAFNYTNERSSMGQAIGTIISKYGVLFVVWFIETILTLLLIIGVPQLLTKFFQPTYRMGQIFELSGLLLGILLASIFAYTTALIILDNQKIIRSLQQTISIFKRNPLISFLLVAVPTLIYFPISFLLRKSPVLITKFSPEIIIAILGIGIFITLFSSYLQIGSITRFYLLINEKRRY